ncbi:MAG: GWxTD domain-containing protein, partial [Acidobacteriota bacterium]|nr:GWxTD domain-containing protein [Acidobacteriota bacterium]
MTRPRRSCRALVAASLVLLVLGVSASTAARKKESLDHLPERHRTWLEEVDLLILKEEREEFLKLEKDYQRDAFIERFWESRDPYVETTRNELRDAWTARLDFVRQEYGSLNEDRARILLLNGEPTLREDLSLCPMLLHPLEVWYYTSTQRSQSSLQDIYLLFYSPSGLGNRRLWRPSEGLSDLFAEPPEILLTRCPERYRTGTGFRTVNPRDIPLECALWIVTQDCDRGERGRLVAAALTKIAIDEKLGGFDQLAVRLELKPPPRDGEWLDSFAAYSTDVASDAETFLAELDIVYPGRKGDRTVVQGTLAVPTSEAQLLDLDGRRSYNFLLTGEVLRADVLFESFRYKFDLPADQVDVESIPLTFERLLRPGEFGLVIKLEDLNSNRLFRQALDLSVPKAETPFSSAPAADPETARLEAEAAAAIRPTSNTLRLIPPPGERLIGPVRFDTAVTGSAFDRVSFFLDGKLMLTKKRPPFSIELDLGRVPRPHTLRVTAWDEIGEIVASDELQLNVGKHHFAVKLLEPQRNRSYGTSVTAEAEISMPEGTRLDRLEIYLGETLLATLYQPPYRQPIELPGNSSLT